MNYQSTLARRDEAVLNAIACRKEKDYEGVFYWKHRIRFYNLVLAQLIDKEVRV